MAVAGVVATAVTVIAALASAAATAYASYQQGQTTAKMAKFSAQQAENQATAARQAAQIRSRQEKERLDHIRASARARAGASGVEMGEGSPLLVMLENANQAQHELELIKYGGEVQAGDFESDAKLRIFQGKAAKQAGNIGAGVALLQGVSSAAGTYYKTRTPSQTGVGIGYGHASTPPAGNYPY